MKENFHKVKASTEFKRQHKADYGKEKIDILYEDEFLVVIHKPSGMLSVPYPGSKARTAQEVLEKIYRSRGELSANHKPLVVHRLDRDTSGVMMVALNESVQKKIMATWHEMVTERIYHAVAENPRDKKKYLPESGLIDAPLAKNAYNVGYVPVGENKNVDTVDARTNYKILFQGPTHTLFELSLDTGKKNQIRAHLSYKGYPLAGDENYRAKTDPFFRLALHARTLAFDHPVTGKKMRFEIPEPEDWIRYVQEGDKSPRTPVWNQKRSRPQPKENEPVQKRLSGKKASQMDFIARGKARDSGRF
ncbi:MAG: RluA family pseudouridine synthase [Treponema sp.]|nr:RluA family pseudouridine synthase [Treponema sp.]